MTKMSPFLMGAAAVTTTATWGVKLSEADLLFPANDELYFHFPPLPPPSNLLRMLIQASFLLGALWPILFLQFLLYIFPLMPVVYCLIIIRMYIYHPHCCPLHYDNWLVFPRCLHFLPRNCLSPSLSLSFLLLALVFFLEWYGKSVVVRDFGIVCHQDLMGLGNWF